MTYEQMVAAGYTFPNGIPTPPGYTGSYDNSPLNPFNMTVANQAPQTGPTYTITPQTGNPFGSTLGSTLPLNTNFVNTGVQNTGTQTSTGGSNLQTVARPTSRTTAADNFQPGVTNGILPGGYGVSNPGPMPFGTGAIGGYPTQTYTDPATGQTSQIPSWSQSPSTNIGDILANDRGYAYAQGGELIGNYGQILADQQQRARQLGAVGDEAYANLLQNPGYTAAQAAGITNQAGLNALTLTPEQQQQNFLTAQEQQASMGNPNIGLQSYTGSEGDIRGAVGGLQTGLSGAIDPSQLGLSGEYQQNYNFTPQDQQDIIEAAGRNVGQATGAITDELQRQANAAGTNSPLALAAAINRQRQTGDVAAADAMTNARIQATQLGLQTEQQKEATRLGAQQYLTGAQMQAANLGGQAAIGAENTIAENQANLAAQGDVQAAQRAQALAQNRQQVSQANQAAGFQRGSYQDTAASQRATQLAGAVRSDQTAGRQDIRNEEQTGYNEANSGMAGQLQAFSGVTGAGQASQANAIRAAQLPTTLDKVIGAASGAAAGAGLAQGGVVDKPTVARVGEDGPEIVIKLPNMNYRRRQQSEVPAYA
jgi:hypothetical protein